MPDFATASALMWLVTLGALLAAALAVAATAATTVLERAEEIGLMKGVGRAANKERGSVRGECYCSRWQGGATGCVVGSQLQASQA